MTADFLRTRTLARLAVLAIQPAEIGSGGGLSPAVSEALRALEESLSAALQDEAGDPQPRDSGDAES